MPRALTFTTMKVDSAIIRALGLNPSTTEIKSHSGSGFSTTSKITTVLDGGSQKQFFVKTGKSKDAQVMFEGEHASLNAIHDVVPTLCPKSHAHGALADTPEAYFLATDFLDLSPRALGSGGSSDTGASGMTLAAKLAKLHTTAAPVPKASSDPVFGFPVTTCCGDTPQSNGFKKSWVDFYAENRLLAILKRSERTNGPDPELRSLIEKVASVIVPRLLGHGHLGGEKGIIPVVVHGDLWSGNKGRGRIGARAAVEDVVFDPSACWAHSEYELGIMKMFGGFSDAFFHEYHSICPKTEPQEEYEDRVSLYEL
ncbi:1-phosphatidylinositol-3-phosphate 5-kinase [Bachmanniomyces sp. S44760]|nr:1-phosphatidylinositol-3-phosphate 5-kinase [Bachmanniomyces sp. S44760]